MKWLLGRTFVACGLLSLTSAALAQVECPRTWRTDIYVPRTQGDVFDGQTSADVYEEAVAGAAALNGFTGFKTYWRVDEFISEIPAYTPRIHFGFNEELPDNYRISSEIVGTTGEVITETIPLSHLTLVPNDDRSGCELVQITEPVQVMHHTAGSLRTLAACLAARGQALSVGRTAASQPFLAICLKADEAPTYALQVFTITKVDSGR